MTPITTEALVAEGWVQDLRHPDFYDRPPYSIDTEDGQVARLGSFTLDQVLGIAEYARTMEELRDLTK